MSLIETSLSDVVKKQYSFKMKVFYNVFGSLAMMQILSILFSLGGVGQSGFSSAGISIRTSYYSADMIIGFTMLWAFSTGTFITTKATRYDDFTFVANRVSSTIANALFLLVASVIGGTIAMLSGSLLKVLSYYVSDVKYGAGSSLIDAPLEFLMGMGAASLYVLLFSALGYLIGMLVQVSRLFIVVLPVLFVGTIIFGAINGFEEQLKAVFNFIFAEPSFLLFFLKIIMVSGLLFAASAAISNRMEVRK